MEEQGNSDIEVTVKTLDSQSRSYTVSAQMTVKEFKEHISTSVGIPVDKQRLIYQGRVLQDEKTLTEYNVNGKVIHLVERAPPQTTQPGSGSGGVAGISGGPQAGNTNSSPTSQGMPHGPTHDRNANSYVMLGTLNLPTSGSANVHVDLDQSLQSEPRLRLLLAENLLRDTIALIQRLEVLRSSEIKYHIAFNGGNKSFCTLLYLITCRQFMGCPGFFFERGLLQKDDCLDITCTNSCTVSLFIGHPSPAELVEMLAELRRVEERMQPFIQRAHAILEAATTADYNNNTQEREEDQRVLNQVGEALRLLGNALVALSDLRCNLSSAPPRHLHVIRPMSHYTSSVLTPGGVHHMPIQVNLGTTVTMSANGRPTAESQPQPTGQSEQQGQGQTPAPQPGMANQQMGQPGPRVIRISHQTMEPVVMMQINIDGGLLCVWVRECVHVHACVLALAHPCATPMNPAALNQMISGLVGQLLTGASGPTHSTSTTASSAPQPDAAPAPPQGAPLGGNLDQILGSLLGGGIATNGQATGVSPAVSVTMPGIPAFIQGVTDFIQASQQAHFQPSADQPAAASSAPPTNEPQSYPEAGTAEEVMNTELFTGIVQGVLSTMMGSLGAPQNNTESIAQFIQRLSQTSNIFTPSTGEAMGFFGDLLTLVCQNFSMVDMVLLLHGQAQPLSRIQPQLSQFFTEHYLQGREPTEANITAAANDLIRELDEYITESFSAVTVREGIDITQTNRSFLRQQLTAIATHILHCTDHTFGPRLLQLCNRALFECLALNLYCLRGEQNALTTVINNRIRTMSAEVNPSVVNWLTSMMTMRLQVILEHIPVTEEQILNYVVHARMDDSLSPAPATTAEEAMATSQEAGAVGGLADETGGAVGGEGPAGEPEAWAAALPPDWVPIIRQDMLSQRKMKAQPPLSDAYLQGMPAKRRKTSQSEGPRLNLSEAVSQAARSVGVTPVTSSSALQGDLERPELQEAYTQQVKNDIKKRVKGDPDYSSRRFPNTHRAFSPDS
uniref:BCL2-associated athanogene 6 n=1 Tax=Pygocentrus nattereri TaxID=42514 RepID=A0AAR2LWL7_PYGNA